MFHIKWPTKLNVLVWKSAFFAKSSPHFSMRWWRPRAQRLECLCKMANQTQFSYSKIGTFCQIVLSFFCEMRKASARAAPKISYKIANQTQFSYLKICNCRQIFALIFLWDEKGRARTARKMFLYITYFLMGFFIERRAQRENVFNI